MKSFSNQKKHGIQRHPTGAGISSDRVGQDIVLRQPYESNASQVIVSASKANISNFASSPEEYVQLEITTHGANVGDMIQFKSGALLSFEASVISIVDANNLIIEWKGDQSVIAAGVDVASVYKFVSVSVSASGSITTAPFNSQFLRNGADQTVTEDTATPANNRANPSLAFFYLDGVQVPVNEDTGTPANNTPLPVKLTGLTGDINVSAGDLNVQTSHLGATFDSQRIGDGITLLGISTANEALTRPNGGVAANAADTANPIKIGARHDAVLPTYDDGDITNLQADANGRLLISSIVTQLLGAFAEDSAHSTGEFGIHGLAVRQDALASSTSTDGDYGSVKANSVGELYIADTTARVTLAALNAKFGSLGQKARAASAPVTLSTEDMTAVGLIAREITLAAMSAKLPATLGQKARVASLATTLSTEDVAILTGMSAKLPATLGQKARAASLAATLSTEDMVVMGAIARETTLAAQSAKLPATLGQKAKAASLAVTIASDQDPLAIAEGDVIDPTALFGLALNDNTGAFVELIAVTSLVATKIQIMQKGGEPLQLGIGAAAAETVKMIVMSGGSPDTIVPVMIPAGSRLSVRSASGNSVAAVDIFFNLIG